MSPSEGGRTGGLVDWAAVSAGTVLALAVSLPVVAIVALVDATVGISCHSDALFLPYLVVLAGMTAGGRRAARRRPDAPLTSGALAALAAFAVVAMATALGRAVGGGTSHCPRSSLSLVFNALTATSAGVAGGLMAARRHRAGAGA